MSENNILEPLVDSLVTVTRQTGSLLWRAGCKAINYKSKEELIHEEELRKEKAIAFEKAQKEKRELEIENKNKIEVNGEEYDFNNLFFNCGLKNKLKDMPILENTKEYNTVNIFSFKLPVGVTASLVREKLEHIADFFEVPQMNIKIQKKNGLMDIIVSKEDIYKKTFNYISIPKTKDLKMPVGHFINQDYMEKLLVVDLSNDNTPHAFIASTTGGGKSNFISVAVLNWVMTKTPEEITIFLIDGKGGTDYAPFLKAPHIYHNSCFFAPDDVIAILEQANKEIKLRNAIFKDSKVKNFKEYNDKRGHMPHHVIIFDEYAVYSSNSKEYNRIQAEVKTICSTGRSAGVHIIVCTQDGRQAILDSFVKYNMPLKIGFKCDNAQHSKNVCGFEGLETINQIGVGRIYGLSIDTEYIQFKTMLAPDSDEIRGMIDKAYPKKENSKSNVVDLTFRRLLAGEEEDDETELIGYSDESGEFIFLGEECED